MLQVIAAESNKELRQHLEEYFYKDADIRLNTLAADAFSLLAETQEYKPAAVCLDMVLTGMDGFETAHRITQLSHKPVIILAVPLATDYIINKALKSGVDYVLAKPYEPEAVKNIVLLLVNRSRLSKKRMEKSASQLMLSLGIPAHLDGYRYAREAIMLYLTGNGRQSLTGIYSDIARKFGKKEHCIERSIRNAVEYAWTHGDIHRIDEIFGYTVRAERGKPSNSEFIAMLSDRLASGS